MKKTTTKAVSIVIFRDKSRDITLRADSSHETIWATLNQLADLFNTDKSGISRHIKNIFKTGELDEGATVAKIATVQNENGRSVTRQIEYFNLDMILSVGYRVNSKQATHFRIWATKTLRDYILKGYAVNEKRLKTIQKAKLSELDKTIKLITGVREKIKNQDEAKGLLSVIDDYTQTWILLNQYDKRDVGISKGRKTVKPFDIEKLVADIAVLKESVMRAGEASDLFGHDRGSFMGIVRGVFQTFGGKELYPTIESKAAHLLYFIIKDHPFSDGNKRIGAFSFLTFLVSQNYLFRKNGERKINDVALTALALLVAESDPNDKDQLVALIMRLIES